MQQGLGWGLRICIFNKFPEGQCRRSGNFTLRTAGLEVLEWVFLFIFLSFFAWSFDVYFVFFSPVLSPIPSGWVRHETLCPIGPPSLH